MKYLFIFICSLGFGNAAVVNISSFNEDVDALVAVFAGVDGVPLSGGYVAGGVFTLTDAEVNALIASQSLSALFEAFIAGVSDDFVEGLDFNLGSGPVSGAYYASESNFDTSSIIGRSLYTIVGNGTTLEDSSEVAIFRHDLIVVADPASPSLPVTYSLFLGSSEGELVFGSISSATVGAPDLSIPSSLVTAYVLSSIPEPSTLLLGAFGAFGLLRRRR